MDFSAFCRGLVAFTSPFVFQGGGALYTHYSHYKHIIECRKSPHPGNCAVGDFGCEISAKIICGDGLWAISPNPHIGLPINKCFWLCGKSESWSVARRFLLTSVCAYSAVPCIPVNPARRPSGGIWRATLGFRYPVSSAISQSRSGDHPGIARRSSEIKPTGPRR